MSSRPPQYWLEYTFSPSEDHKLGDLVKGTVSALSQATAQVDNGKVLFLFKVLAEPKLIAVIQATNAAELESAFAANPVPSPGRLVHVQCRPLRPYETMAKEVLGIDTSYQLTEEWTDEPGQFYWITASANYKGMTQEEFFEIYKQEVKLALVAMEHGVSKLFTVVAEKTIMILVKKPTPDMVDNAFTSVLPMFRQLGNQITMSCKPVVPYQQ